MIPRPSSRLAALAAALLAISCATYPERTEEALADFSRGHLEAAHERYSDPGLIDSPFLAGVEEGTVALAAGWWPEALAAFTSAAEAVRELEDRGLLSPASLAEGAESWLFSDASTAYQGEGYERVYLHASLGLAYLALGQVDDFGVEVRRANRLLETEEELYDTEYRAGGLGHFLSATYYELRGDLDDAYIDYLRMEEKGVGAELAGPALVRIAEALGRDDELARWRADYGDDVERPEGAAVIVVVGGVGLGPYKIEHKLTLPLRGGLFSMAAPSLVPRPQPVDALRLEIGGEVGVRTAVLEDVSDVARENLEDRLALVVAKSAARGILKREVTQSLQREHGVAGRVAGDLFTFLSERADLRAWLTLPDTWQACRVFVPPGVHDVAIEAVGGARVDLGRLRLEPGETLFVLARSVRRNLFAHAIGGRPVADGAPDP